MKVSTANSLMKTTVVLKFADSLMPMIRMVVTARMARKATRLKLVVTCCVAFETWLMLSADSGNQRPSTIAHFAPGTSQICGGVLVPESCREATSVELQPEAPVAAPKAYSKMRPQPMTHAMISPSVA